MKENELKTKDSAMNEKFIIKQTRNCSKQIRHFPSRGSNNYNETNSRLIIFCILWLQFTRLYSHLLKKKETIKYFNLLLLLIKTK